jgi:hypothetical protein
MKRLARQAPTGASEFLASLRRGLLIGGALLVLAWPVMHENTPRQPASNSAVVATSPRPVGSPKAATPGTLHRRAQFGDTPASPDARQVANWAFYTADHGSHAVVVVDKTQARVFVFAPDGRLQGATPALLGSAHGDHTVPGVGDKPLSQVLPEERTTPAGRFVAQRGMNLQGEDVVWVDYDAAVSMHRVRPTVKAERRLERLASPTPDDNRISFGCINLPKAFYEQVLSPAVSGTGAVIYVLPETRRAAHVFGSYDVPDTTAMAQR